MSKVTPALECTVEVYQTCWGFTAAVYAEKQLRYLSDHCTSRETAERAGRDWAVGVERIKRWQKVENNVVEQKS